jgi:hypothetical protein
VSDSDDACATLEDKLDDVNGERSSRHHAPFRYLPICLLPLDLLSTLGIGRLAQAYSLIDDGDGVNGGVDVRCVRMRSVEG